MLRTRAGRDQRAVVCNHAASAMSEYRDAKRQLEERIRALKEENEDLLAQLTESEARLVERDIELARSKDHEPRRFAPFMLLPIAGLCGLFAFIFFRVASPAAPAVATAPPPKDVPAVEKAGRIALRFTSATVSESRAEALAAGAPCHVELVAHWVADGLVWVESLDLSCGAERWSRFLSAPTAPDPSVTRMAQLRDLGGGRWALKYEGTRKGERGEAETLRVDTGAGVASLGDGGESTPIVRVAISPAAEPRP